MNYEFYGLRVFVALFRYMNYIGEMSKLIVIMTLIGAIIASLVSPFAVFSQTREELESELKKIEEQIAGYEKELANTKTEKKTLSNKISQLKKEQERIVLQIKSTNIQINELGKELTSTETSIQSATEKLDRSKEQAAEILRDIYERSQKTFVEILLDESGLFSFFSQLETLEQLSKDLMTAMDKVKIIKGELEVYYGDLEAKREERKNMLAIQILQNRNLSAKTSEQNKLLKDTQGKEVQYQASLADSKKRAQEIRNRIYELLDVSAQITFGEAVEIAQWVEEVTGIRAALLLAVLTQESSLGKNIGQCTLVDTVSGHSRSMKYGTVFSNGMHPTRDLPPFLSITADLGRDPLVTPISCPMAGVKGYGGAMGPAQFIPSTWAPYRSKIAVITGKNASNPWDIKDAFIAAALLLKDNGAASGKNNAEWRAAMLYFSGSTNIKFRFYGDNVIALANKYEEDIKVLE